MSDTIDYYFSLASPWAYLGHAKFMDMRARHGFSVNFKPVFLPNVFEHTGGLVLPKRHPVRQRYRLLEMQRWRDKRGVPLNIHPQFWPFDCKFADRTILAAAMLGHDPDAYVRLCFAGVWANELNLAEVPVLEGLLKRAGLDATAILAAADSAPVTAAYERHVEEAVASDVIGSPGYVRRGELFWGQDRLELLEDAVASGREGYRPV